MAKPFLTSGKVVIAVKDGEASLVSRPPEVKVMMRDYSIEGLDVPQSELGRDESGEWYREFELE